MSKPKIHPILFNTAMARAILDGRKTQTRRIVKSVFKGEGQPTSTHTLIDIQKWEPLFEYQEFWWNRNATGEHEYKAKPLYSVGDILWVRETWREWSELDENYDTEGFREFSKSETLSACYRASCAELEPEDREAGLKWMPSIYMPKKHCRTWLKVLDVRVERLQKISWNDAIAEGIDRELLDTSWMYYGPERIEGNGDPRVAFKQIWDSLAKKGTRWSDNPWVWVYEFEGCDRPEGFLDA